MSWHGDISLGDTIDIKFTTRNFSTGAPFTLAGTPVVSAYPGNSVTQITAGITLTVDFDAVTGLHNVRVVATSGNGYADATNYALVITTGTVNGVSVVGEVVGSFSISARSALRPTVAGRTLDVSAGGEAGVDWANVGTPGSTVSLSATTVATVTTTTTATNLTTNNDKTGYALSAAQTFNMTGNITGNLSGSVGSVTGAVGSVTGAVGSVTGAVGSVTGAVGSVAGNVDGNVTGSVGSLAAQAKADVNAEVVDGLNVDTYAEPGQGAPAATASIVTKIGNLHKAWRNKSDQTSTLYQLYADDATTVDQKPTVSDDGTTFVRQEIASGP